MASRWPIVELPRSRWDEFRHETVKDTSLALLSHVAAVADCGRTVGLSYAHISEIVRALRPGARTSSACLRWYVGHSNDGDPDFAADLPQVRPRSAVGRTSARVT